MVIASGSDGFGSFSAAAKARNGKNHKVIAIRFLSIIRRNRKKVRENGVCMATWVDFCNKLALYRGIVNTVTI
jgi:hypothetical protein